MNALEYAVRTKPRRKLVTVIATGAISFYMLIGIGCILVGGWNIYRPGEQEFPVFKTIVIGLLMLIMAMIASLIQQVSSLSTSLSQRPHQTRAD